MKISRFIYAPLIAIFGILCFTTQSNAQLNFVQGEEVKLRAEHAEEPELIESGLVGTDLESPPADGERVFEYVIELLPNGLFRKRVSTTDGRPVMQGTYLDESLEIPHGEHIHFHWTGIVESQGEYRNGYRFGTWKRFAFSGERLPDKTYGFQGVENTLIRNDQASFAGPFEKPVKKKEQRAQF